MTSRRSTVLLTFILTIFLIWLFCKDVELSTDEYFKELLLRQGMSKQQDRLCQSSDGIVECFQIVDEIHLIKDKSKNTKKIVATRYILIEDIENSYLTASFLHSPEQLTFSSMDTSKWKVNKLGSMKDHYDKVMIEHLFSTKLLEMTSSVEAKIMLIGLGGGQTANFIQTAFPNIDITAVDISPMMKTIALKWFQLQENDKLEVLIDDGVKVLEQHALAGRQYDSIMIDACNNNLLDTFVCPIRPFLTFPVLHNVRTLLGERGILMYNWLLSGKEGRKEHNDAMDMLKSVFKHCVATKLPKVDNHVVYCSNSPLLEDSRLQEEARTFVEAFSQDFS